MIYISYYSNNISAIVLWGKDFRNLKFVTKHDWSLKNTNKPLEETSLP